MRFLNQIYCTEFTSLPVWQSGYNAQLSISRTLYESDDSSSVDVGETILIFQNKNFCFLSWIPSCVRWRKSKSTHRPPIKEHYGVCANAAFQSFCWCLTRLLFSFIPCLRCSFLKPLLLPFILYLGSKDFSFGINPWIGNKNNIHKLIIILNNAFYVRIFQLQLTGRKPWNNFVQPAKEPKWMDPILNC